MRMMNYARNRDRYLNRYAALKGRSVYVRSLQNIQNAVAIPVLQEKGTLFESLASIAKNPASDLEKTVVICVVNNHSPTVAGPAAISENQETLDILYKIVKRSGIPVYPEQRLNDSLGTILDSRLRLACVDASSPGNEIPDNLGGVGTARKIAMDAAVMLIDKDVSANGIISCLDADTTVEENFLSAIRRYFWVNNVPAATVRYAHRMPSDMQLLSAICRYEIFIRSYVIGLMFAGSPYAFPAIGSTISCTAGAYVAVRGMNTKEAAEDFHFLDKLAKIGRIGFIENTTVHPSARISERVPFGTGSKMKELIENGSGRLFLHDPEVFKILRLFLSETEFFLDKKAVEIMFEVSAIHPALSEYLTAISFPKKWEAIRDNSVDPGQIRRQFHLFFDGLKTLRLIHYLSRRYFPPVEMFAGLKGLLKMTGKEMKALKDISTDSADSEDLFNVLQELRIMFPHS